VALPRSGQGEVFKASNQVGSRLRFREEVIFFTFFLFLTALPSLDRVQLWRHHITTVTLYIIGTPLENHLNTTLPHCNTQVTICNTGGFSRVAEFGGGSPFVGSTHSGVTAVLQGC
jgi:hypothetical protein